MWKKVNSFGLNIVRIQDTQEKEQPILDLGTKVTIKLYLKGGSAGWMNRLVYPNNHFKGESSSLLLFLKRWRKG